MCCFFVCVYLFVCLCVSLTLNFSPPSGTRSAMCVYTLFNFSRLRPRVEEEEEEELFNEVASKQNCVEDV